MNLKITEKPDYDAVVIGAGPYGLSAGAYLQAKGLRVHVFGKPMEFWAEKMPAGMLLRSPRPASSVADPRSAYTLERFESQSGTKPEWPVRLETFVEYGRWFRSHLGSNLEACEVSRIERKNSLFRVTLQDGETVGSSRVVVAAGIGPFRKVPVVFQNFSPERVSHCYEGRKLAEFGGKRVTVIGAGQSALESAALLHETGADVEVISRIPKLRWIGAHGWLHHLGYVSQALYSEYDVGPAGISRLVACPQVVRRIPLNLRDRIRVRAVRPAGAPWLVPRLKNVKITSGRSLRSVASLGRQVQLKLDDGTSRVVDHVLLGTGYRVDISLYPFLAAELIREVRQLDGSPALRAGFESSVPGLHFIGAAAARSYGPLLYFVAGTEFASRELTSSIARDRVKAPLTESLVTAQ
jgi:FAD-dependent urate hydroxylase